MRFFMIAAAISVAALGFTGCAMTGGGGGCQSGTCGCESEMISTGGCGDAGCSDCQAPETAECGCGGGGCDKCSKYGDMTGMHGDVPSSGYGGGVQNTGMGMTIFDRGSKCDSGSGGCSLLGGGCLANRLGGGRLRAGLPCRSQGALVESVESVEASSRPAPVRGLIGRLKDANAAALAQQEAEFGAGNAVGCGAPGCGAGGCAACVGGIVRHAAGQPYGGAVPHTTPPPAGPGSGAGTAPTYAYPYYTTRGPRDFLAREPMSIGY